MPPRRVWLALVACAVVLALLSLAGAIASTILPPGRHAGLIERFDLGAERSLPTWFSSLVLLMNGVVFAVIARLKHERHDRLTIYWAALALLLIALSMEEIADFHTLPILPARLRLSAQSYLYSPWVGLGAAVVVALALGFSRFLLALPRATALRMVLAAAVYFGGAIGGEIAGGRITALGGRDSWAWALSSITEEWLEMIGSITLLATMLGYLQSTFGPPALVFAPAAADGATTAPPKSA